MKRWSFVSAFLVCALLASTLAGCDQQESGRAEEIVVSANRNSGPAEVQMIEEESEGLPKRLAVSHNFSLRLPSADVQAVQQSHLAECAKLKCSVLETSINNYGTISAEIDVRLAPEAFDTFVKIISGPPATVVSHRESSEDKTLAFRDAEKRLEVKTALRARLLELLKDPARKSAADLAAVEKELAQVQGDIEQAVTERNYLRTITETVRMTINYQGTTAQAGGFDLSPLERAVTNIGRTLISSLATLVSFIAALIPWSPFIALVVWGGWRGYRRWKRQESR